MPFPHKNLTFSIFLTSDILTLYSLKSDILYFFILSCDIQTLQEILRPHVDLHLLYASWLCALQACIMHLFRQATILATLLNQQYPASHPSMHM